MLSHIDQDNYSTLAVGHFDKPGKYDFNENNCLKTRADYWSFGWSIFDNN